MWLGMDVYCLALDSFLLTNLLYQDFIFILIYLGSLQRI